MNRIHNIPSRNARGVTLVELLVAVAIGLVVVLAATNVLVIGEAHKRSTSGNNDSSQSGSFAAYSLDRALRSAGSGFAQSWDQSVFGCRLGASRIIGTATTILPRTDAFPAPFQFFLGGAGAALAGNLRLAPVLIAQGQSAGNSDVLMVMSGNGSAGDIARPIRSSVPATNNLRLDNTVGFK
ncbi:MAG: prepilin-type N-terminal cleavage/methylation domain-containing protein, partial [Pseudoxanthomonas sp.]